MITCYYGLKWKRELGDWGSRGVTGTLCGKTGDSKINIDCTHMKGIYILCNKSKILYISNSWKEGRHSIYDCLKNHTKQKSLTWDTFSWFGIDIKYPNTFIATLKNDDMASQYFEEILKLLLDHPRNSPGKIRPRDYRYIQFKQVKQ